MNSSTVGTPFIYISPTLQSFYAARWMWLNGQPQSALVAMLGPLAWPATERIPPAYYVTDAQLAALVADMRANGPKVLSGCQIGQVLRRWREAAARAGSPRAALPEAAQCRAAQPSAAVPFTALQRPAAGKAKKSFEDHVMRTVRDFVDFTQGSEYMATACCVRVNTAP